MKPLGNPEDRRQLSDYLKKIVEQNRKNQVKSKSLCKRRKS